MSEEKNEERNEPKGRGRTKWKKQDLLTSYGIYHPNHRGDGSAMCVKMSPAKLSVPGYVQIELAKQQTVGDSERKVFPTFNWRERIIIRLTPIEVGEVIRCLRGMTESVRDGAGFSHRTDGRAAKITMSRMTDPRPCHVLKVMSETIAGVEKEVEIRLYDAESTSFECALSSSMGRLWFGP